MSRPASYKTKQKEAVLAYIASLERSHATAAQVVEYFEKEEIPISRTTVYRNLEKLTESGEVRKYAIDGVSGACFQYVGKSIVCREHFHLKCESCGELLHLQCSTSDEFKNHISNKHDFEINAMKTVLYGKCHNCVNGA